ncbi:MAG: NTPase [Promethearchaeota archaeon]
MLENVNVLVTGLPGCGKSTLVNRLLATAQQQGFKVGGIRTPEFRDFTKKRVGFFIQDIASGEQLIMASVKIESPVSVGRYRVNLEAIQQIGVAAINAAIEKADLIVIDEIGKMELAVSDFLPTVLKALNSTKPVLGTIGLRLKIPAISKLKTRSDVTLLTLKPENRTQIYQEIQNRFGL